MASGLADIDDRQLTLVVMDALLGLARGSLRHHVFGANALVMLACSQACIYSWEQSTTMPATVSWSAVAGIKTQISNADRGRFGCRHVLCGLQVFMSRRIVGLVREMEYKGQG